MDFKRIPTLKKRPTIFVKRPPLNPKQRLWLGNIVRRSVLVFEPDNNKARVRDVLASIFRRPLHAGLALVVAAGLVGASLSSYLINNPAYVLTAQAESILNKPYTGPNSQVSFEPGSDSYLVNVKGMQGGDAGNPHILAGQPSDGVFSARLPVDLSKGITVTDNSNHVQFSFQPEFGAAQGKQVDGHFVYPLGNGDIQAVYTPQDTQLAEDLLINQPAGNVLSFNYKLKLPKGLQAFQLGNGGVGIESSGKVLFQLSAPVIRQSGQKQKGKGGNAKLVLNGDQLTLLATGLSHLSYPLSIDPSVIVNSATSLLTGNNEGGINLSTNQATEGGLTGGTVGTWTSTSSLPTALAAGAGTVTYNGYVYSVGGNAGGVGGLNYVAAVSYAPLSSSGGLSTQSSCPSGWTLTNSSWCYNLYSLPQALNGVNAVAYNGYLYAIGGINASYNDVATVYYAKINSDHSIGSWNSLNNNLPTAMDTSNTPAYNGFIYHIGGYTNGYSEVPTANVYFAEVNPAGGLVTSLTSCPGSGTLYNGTWCQTSSLPQARAQGYSPLAYNGYVYEIGGDDGTNNYNTAYYAQINKDGTLGTWQSTTTIPGTIDSDANMIYDGYIYIVGGYNGGYTSAVYCAPLYADGTIGPWTTTTSLTANAVWDAGVAYDGYLYEFGGNAGSGTIATVTYAKINSAGYTSSYTSTTTLPAVASGHPSNNYYPANATSAVYNGYIYELGGDYARSTGTYLGPEANVNYAPINSAGTLGSWTSTTALTTATWGAASVTYNGYVYEIGGCTAGTTSCSTYSSAVHYDSMSTGGGLGGSWSTTTSLPATVEAETAIVYNGYIYVIGGYNGSYSSTVSYAQIGSSGALVNTVASCPTGWTLSGSTWCYESSLPTARDLSSAVVSDGYLYILGGYNGSYSSTVSYAPLGTNGGFAIMSSCPNGNWTLSGSTWCSSNASATNLPATRDNGSAIAYNGYIYYLGGYNGSAQSTAYYASINSDGSTSTWSTNQALSATTYAASAVTYNGYVYQLGGSTGGTFTGTVSYASIGNGGPGETNSWNTSTNTFTNARFGLQSVAYNGYLYVIGGDGAGHYNDVQYAKIGNYGTLGTWSPANTYTFTTARCYFGTAVYNGYLYVMGGQANCGGSGSVLNDIQYAKLGSNGAPGSFTTVNSAYDFPTPRFGFQTLVYNGYMYVIGGNSSSGMLNDVEYVPLNSDGSITTAWSSTNSFVTGRRAFGAIIYNGYMYVGGGTDGTNYFNDMQYAAIQSNGTLAAPSNCSVFESGSTTWCSAASFTTPRKAFRMVAYNGFLYIMGGIDSGSTEHNDVRYAAVDANGSLSGWSSANTFTNGRQDFGAAIYNGFIYISGGNNGGTNYGDVQYVGLQSIPRIGNYSMSMGIGNTIGPESSGVGTWSSATSLSTNTAYATSVVYSGYVYELGGYNSVNSQLATVEYAPLSGSGGLGTQASCPGGWTLSGSTWCYNSTSLPMSTDGGTAVTYNGYVYYMGGYNGTADVQTVAYAQLSTSGGFNTMASCPAGWTLSGSTWCYNTTSLPEITEEATSVVSGGYVYEIGGYSGAYTTNVYYAPINANGSLGTWTATGSLPAAAGYTSSVVSGSTVYVIGGSSGSGGTQTVSYSTLSSGGGLSAPSCTASGWTLSGSWCTNSSNLSQTVEGGSSVIYNGYIYEVSGDVGGSDNTSVLEAPINGDGSVGSWSNTTSSPGISYKGTAVVYGSYLYQLGGYDGTNYYPSVYYAPFPASQLANVDATPLSIETYGTNTGNPGVGGYAGIGGITIDYRITTAECPALSSSSTVNMVPNELNTPFSLTATSDGCGNTTSLASYVWAFYTLDDTQTASFPDVNGNHTDITGFQVSYHPATSVRLRGGATFNNQTLQALDTPPTTKQ